MEAEEGRSSGDSLDDSQRTGGPASAPRDGAPFTFNHKPASNCTAAVFSSSSLEFQEPKPHTEYQAIGVAPHSVLRCVQYDNTVPYTFVCGQLDRPADCKLGGVNSDVSEAVVVNLVRELTSDTVRIVAVDLFGYHQGLCRLWLAGGAADFRAVKQALHGVVWMGPLRQHCAVVARRGDQSRNVLEQFLATHATQPSSFPRHTMTVEPWES